ncbi:hypothetical protein FXV83_32305 [Bradyrhizobium hipponense]|uniref:Uncharacterized protein n=1 Tax=Bradyrhizobium hipponense TaxID=2605638 RepID=A0A5S4YGU5_9BRAD|nr:hypothetical protein FXV83_32305 [Bradyrhizobium hipponense]
MLTGQTAKRSDCCSLVWGAIEDISCANHDLVSGSFLALTAASVALLEPARLHRTTRSRSRSCIRKCEIPMVSLL